MALTSTRPQAFPVQSFKNIEQTHAGMAKWFDDIVSAFQAGYVPSDFDLAVLKEGLPSNLMAPFTNGIQALQDQAARGEFANPPAPEPPPEPKVYSVNTDAQVRSGELVVDPNDYPEHMRATIKASLAEGATRKRLSAENDQPVAQPPAEEVNVPPIDQAQGPSPVSTGEGTDSVQNDMIARAEELIRRINGGESIGPSQLSGLPQNYQDAILKIAQDKGVWAPDQNAVTAETENPDAGVEINQADQDARINALLQRTYTPGADPLTEADLEGLSDISRNGLINIARSRGVWGPEMTQAPPPGADPLADLNDYQRQLVADGAPVDLIRKLRDGTGTITDADLANLPPAVQIDLKEIATGNGMYQAGSVDGETNVPPPPGAVGGDGPLGGAGDGQGGEFVTPTDVETQFAVLTDSDLAAIRAGTMQVDHTKYSPADQYKIADAASAAYEARKAAGEKPVEWNPEGFTDLRTSEQRSINGNQLLQIISGDLTVDPNDYPESQRAMIEAALARGVAAKAPKPVEVNVTGSDGVTRSTTVDATGGNIGDLQGDRAAPVVVPDAPSAADSNKAWEDYLKATGAYDDKAPPPTVADPPVNAPTNEADRMAAWKKYLADTAAADQTAPPPTGPGVETPEGSTNTPAWVFEGGTDPNPGTGSPPPPAYLEDWQRENPDKDWSKYTFKQPAPGDPTGTGMIATPISGTTPPPGAGNGGVVAPGSPANLPETKYVGLYNPTNPDTGATGGGGTDQNEWWNRRAGEENMPAYEPKEANTTPAALSAAGTAAAGRLGAPQPESAPAPGNESTALSKPTNWSAITDAAKVGMDKTYEDPTKITQPANWKDITDAAKTEMDRTYADPTKIERPDLFDDAAAAASKRLGEESAWTDAKMQEVLDFKLKPYFERLADEQKATLARQNANGLFWSGDRVEQEKNILSDFSRQVSQDVAIPLSMEFLNNREADATGRIDQAARIGSDQVSLDTTINTDYRAGQESVAGLRGDAIDRAAGIAGTEFDMDKGINEDYRSGQESVAGLRGDAIDRAVDIAGTEFDMDKGIQTNRRADIDQAASIGVMQNDVELANREDARADRALALDEGALTGYYRGEAIWDVLRQGNDIEASERIASGFTYVDPVTGEQRRVLGTDERADKDFLRAEDVRNGYSMFETVMDENGNRQVVTDADGNPVTRHVMGTQELDEWISNEELRLKEDGMDADEAHAKAVLDWDKQKQSGYYATIDTPTGPRQIWIEGTVGLEKTQMDLEKTLTEMGYDQQTSERIARQQYEEKVAAGYWTRTNNGEYVKVRGTQDHEEYMAGVMDDYQVNREEAERIWLEEVRTGYDKIEERTVRNYETGEFEKKYVKIHVEGTQDFEEAMAKRQEDLVRDGWADEDAKRLAEREWDEKVARGYWATKLEWVPGEDGKPGSFEETVEYVEGSQEHEKEMMRLANEYDIDVEDARAANQLAAQDSAELHDRWMMERERWYEIRFGYKQDEAMQKAQQDWETAERALDRTFEESMTDKRLKAEEARWDAETSREMTSAAIGLIGSMGVDLGSLAWDAAFGDDDPYGISLYDSILKDPKLTDEQKASIMKQAGTMLTDANDAIPESDWKWRGLDGGYYLDSKGNTFDPKRNELTWNGIKRTATKDNSPTVPGNAPGLSFPSGVTSIPGAVLSTPVGGVAAIVAVAYGTYKFMDYVIGRKPSRGWTDENMSDAEAYVDDVMSTLSIADQERLQTFIDDSEVMKHPTPRLLSDLSDRIESADFRTAPQREMSYMSDGLRQLYAAGTFEKKRGDLTTGEDANIERIWKTMPGMARSGNSVSDVSADQMYKDVQAFARDMSIMNAPQINEQVTLLSSLDDSPANWTRDDKTRINLLYDQLGGLVELSPTAAAPLGEEYVRDRYMAEADNEEFKWTSLKNDILPNISVNMLTGGQFDPSQHTLDEIFRSSQLERDLKGPGAEGAGGAQGPGAEGTGTILPRDPDRP